MHIAKKGNLLSQKLIKYFRVLLSCLVLEGQTVFDNMYIHFFLRRHFEIYNYLQHLFFKRNAYRPSRNGVKNGLRNLTDGRTLLFELSCWKVWGLLRFKCKYY